MDEDERIEAEKDKPIPLEDSTPPISEQAKAAGWQAEYYNFGKLEGDGNDYFNPSIVERPDGIWLLVRRSEPHPYGLQWGQNDVWAFMTENNGVTPTRGQRLGWRVREPSQHFEDPRGFYHPRINQTLIGACTFIWYPHQRWTGPHQCFGAFDGDWNCVRMNYPEIGGNPGAMIRIEKHEDYEKNWLWWLDNETLYMLYKAKPWTVYQFGETWVSPKVYKDEVGASWAWGDIRGGTPPVKVGDYYYTFHHSSLNWKGRYRRYYAGCLAFEANPPFRPKMITKEPIFTGSQNDTWAHTKPLVVFPCGAIHRNGEWFITMGVNDMRSAWAKIPHDSLIARMSPLDNNAIPIFDESGLSEGEQSKPKEYSDDAVEVPKPDNGQIVIHRRRKRKKRQFSPEVLEKLRANAYKAREARLAKKLALQK
jgi:predicted GH43/DUF377 family glycosyl hydrolase